MSDELSPTSTPAPRWRAVPAEQLAWLNFDEQFVVYHRPSGKTHLLNAASAQLIRQVLAEARTAQSAAVCLAGDGSDDAYVELVAGLLLRLEELGLVRRGSP